MARDLAEQRRADETTGLSEADAPADPIVLFGQWFTDAGAAVHLPEAMVLATTAEDGSPAARAVLLKGFGPDGFVFFTNYDSRKGRELAGDPRAALCFVWNPLHRQVRVEGRVDRIDSDASDAYFRGRPRGARLAAVASPQSQVVADRDALEALHAAAAARHPGVVPRPENWGGFAMMPAAIEFWQGRSDRLHDRLIYRRTGDRWRLDRLAP